MKPADPPKTLGERIAQARREASARMHRDLTQGDLAEAVGVGAATMSRWESDLATPREEALTLLARFLGVTNVWLRYGVPETKTPRSEEQGGAFRPENWRDVTAEAEAALAAEEEAQASETKRRKNGGRK